MTRKTSSDFMHPNDPNQFLLSTGASAVSAVKIAEIMTWPQLPEFEQWLRDNIAEFPVTLTLPPELVARIGTTVSYWAVAEWIQAGTLARRLGIGRREGRVVYGARIGNCISKIRQLMEMKDIAF